MAGYDNVEPSQKVEQCCKDQMCELQQDIMAQWEGGHTSGQLDLVDDTEELM